MMKITENICIELYIYYRNYSQEIPSDVTIQIGEASYSLHKVA
jgi:hypothetical protein